MSICMTNGGMYSNVSSVNGCDVSEIKREVLTEILENDTFMYIVLNSGQTAILRTSCISSINYF